MSVPERRRAALFVIVCAILVGSALAFAAGDNQLGATGAPTSASGGAEGAVAQSPSGAAQREEQRLEREVKTTARRFLAAFLPYEVGELGPGVRRALRAGSTPGFARQMLARPPGRAPPRMRSSARLGPIAVTFVSALPPRAVISATAERGAATEQISFVFERRGSSWLASGAGQ